MEPQTIACAHREPWNKGKLVGQKAPFKLKEIWAIRVQGQAAVIGPSVLRHTYASANQGHIDLSSHQKPQGGAAAARAHQAGEYRALPRH